MHAGGCDGEAPSIANAQSIVCVYHADWEMGSGTFGDFENAEICRPYNVASSGFHPAILAISAHNVCSLSVQHVAESVHHNRCIREETGDGHAGNLRAFRDHPSHRQTEGAGTGLDK